MVVLASATARHHFEPDGWNGDLEKALAVAALGPSEAECCDMIEDCAQGAARCSPKIGGLSGSGATEAKR